MGYEFFTIFIALLATCILLRSKVLQWQDRWLRVTLISVLFIATIIRVYKLGSAMGLNSNEAMGRGTMHGLSPTMVLVRI